MADQTYEWTVTHSENKLPAAEREAILDAPVFGTKFTDHQVVVTWEQGKGWHSASVIPYGPIMMDPAAAVLHYGQEIFEGIDRKSTRLNSSHSGESRMPSSA